MKQEEVEKSNLLGTVVAVALRLSRKYVWIPVEIIFHIMYFYFFYSASDCWLGKFVCYVFYWQQEGQWRKHMYWEKWDYIWKLIETYKTFLKMVPRGA